MSSIADDYEEFEMVSNTATKWAEEDGLQFDRKEVLRELAELIQLGYAQAYILSAHPPHTLVADYSEARADDRLVHVDGGGNTGNGRARCSTKRWIAKVSFSVTVEKSPYRS
jgi:hypothetical protein